MKQVGILLLTAFLAIQLTACGRQEPPAASSSAPAASAAASVSLPEPYVPAGKNPLTGEPMEEAYENLRPVAVMLNNLKAAQPQLGVSLADVIYEIPAEGGITRMLALYQTLEGCGVENLGTIRSTRPYYIEIALGHDALLVHAGGSPEAYRDISDWGVDNMDGVNGGSDAELFWRDPQRRKAAGLEHSMLTSGENILSYLNEGHFRTDHKDSYSYVQRFAEDGTPKDGTAAEHITVQFSQYKKAGTFDFDAAAGEYLIGQYGEAYIDGNTERQVGVTNLLILETQISVISGDTYGRLKVKTTGQGEGDFFCGGRSIPIQWSRPNRSSPFSYTTASGAPLVLGQGKTYVCVISPKTSTVTVE